MEPAPVQITANLKLLSEAARRYPTLDAQWLATVPIPKGLTICATSPAAR